MQGWTLRDGLWVNDSVETCADAITRGGSMAFDPSTLGTITLPYSDGSGDLLRHTPILPPNTQVGTMEETDYGFRFPCTGGLTEIAIVDSRNETMWGLHAGLGDMPGAKVIWSMPPSAVKDDGGGIWRPKRSVLSGHPFNIAIQPRRLIDYDEFGEIAGTRPAWAAGAVSVYAPEGKRHNLLHADGTRHRCYMTGKIAQFAAHFACFWKAGKLIGRVTGWYEWDAANSHLVKCLDLAECMTYINAGADSVSIDDTVGYTSTGSGTASARVGHLTGAFQPASNGTGTSIHWYGAVGSASVTTNFLVLYNDVARDNNPAGAAKVANSQSPDFTGSTSLAWHNISYVTGPTITTSQYLWLMVHVHTTSTTHSMGYEYNPPTTSSTYVHQYGTIGTNPAEDPCPSTTNRFNDSWGSMYVTYSAGGGGGGPVKSRYLHLYKMRMQ